DMDGKPYEGSLVVSIYDRSVEYISGGSNVPAIKEFFWKWRRHHNPSTESSLARYFQNLLKRNETSMGNLGIFGDNIIEEMGCPREGKDQGGAPPPAPGAGGPGGGFSGGRGGGGAKNGDDRADKKAPEPGAPPDGSGPMGQEPSVRKNFADTAYWNA